jgi:uncharacterized protein
MEAELTRDFLTSSRSIAVLGATPNPDKAGFYIPQRMHSKGYHIIPVNPTYVGETLWGQQVRANLGQVGEPVDILNVFRRPETLEGHLEEILTLKPRLVWLQSGIRNDGFAEKLEAAGIPVVQDACIAVSHRLLVG